MTIAPDQGMAQLFHRMRRDGAGRMGPQPGDGQHDGHGQAEGGGAELDIMVRLAAALGRSADAAERAARPRIPWEDLHPVEIFPNSSNAAGTLDDPDRWGPRQYFAWEISWLVVSLLAGTTSVSVYRDTPGNPADIIFGPVSQSALWEPRRMILMPNSRLVVTSVGGGVIVAGQALEIALPWLPEHLL